MYDMDKLMNNRHHMKSFFIFCSILRLLIQRWAGTMLAQMVEESLYSIHNRVKAQIQFVVKLLRKKIPHPK
jgi:hypothetical protein